VTNALELTDTELARIGRAARERTLDEHSSAKRAEELLAVLEHTRAAPAVALAPFDARLPRAAAESPMSSAP
jgi:hypothetical protein